MSHTVLTRDTAPPHTAAAMEDEYDTVTELVPSAQRTAARFYTTGGRADARREVRAMAPVWRVDAATPDAVLALMVRELREGTPRVVARPDTSGHVHTLELVYGGPDREREAFERIGDTDGVRVRVAPRLDDGGSSVVMLTAVRHMLARGAAPVPVLLTAPLHTYVEVQQHGGALHVLRLVVAPDARGTGRVAATLRWLRDTFALPVRVVDVVNWRLAAVLYRIADFRLELVTPSDEERAEMREVLGVVFDDDDDDDAESLRFDAVSTV